MTTVELPLAGHAGGPRRGRRARTLRLFVVLEFAATGATRVEQLDVLDTVATVGTLTYNRDAITAATLAELAALLARTTAVRVRSPRRRTGGRRGARRVRRVGRRCRGLTATSSAGSSPWRRSASRRPAIGSAPSRRTRSVRVDGLVRSEQLEGLLVHAIRRGDARLAPAQVEVVAAQHGDSMARSLHLERAALAASAVLESAGIGHVLLKGVALANAVYPDAGQRPFGDVDLLLDPQRFTAGIATLRAAGASRHLPEVRPGHDRRFAKDVPLAFESAALDLHRTLIAGPLGRRIPVVELLDRRRQIMIGGRAMAMLDLADAYVHAGLTAGAADVPARLITLRDMLELEAQPGFDADAVLARARVWGVEAALARAVVVLEDRLCPDVPPALSGWARRHVAGRIDRFVLRCYTVSARSYRRSAGGGGVRTDVERPGGPAARPRRAATPVPAGPWLDTPPAPRSGGAQADPLTRRSGQGAASR